MGWYKDLFLDKSSNGLAIFDWLIRDQVFWNNFPIEQITQFYFLVRQPI